MDGNLHEACCQDDLTQTPIDTWPLEAEWVSWVLAEARNRQIDLIGAEYREAMGWSPCQPSDLLPRLQASSSRVWVTQRPGCGGLLTFLMFSDGDGDWGAWFVDREPGASETPSWRSILLQSLVWAGREENPYERLACAK